MLGADAYLDIRLPGAVTGTFQYGLSARLVEVESILVPEGGVLAPREALDEETTEIAAEVSRGLELGHKLVVPVEGFFRELGLEFSFCQYDEVANCKPLAR